MTEVTPNLPHLGNFCKYCFMGTLLSCVDGFSGLWGLFFWQSQNFIFDQLIGLVKGFDHLVGFQMEIDFIQRFGFGCVPNSTFQDILVDTCAITKAGVGMAGTVFIFSLPCSAF